MVALGLGVLALSGVVTIIALMIVGEDPDRGSDLDEQPPPADVAGADNEPGPPAGAPAEPFADLGLAELESVPSTIPPTRAVLDLVRGHIGSNHPPDFATIRFVAATPDGTPAFVVIDQDRNGLCVFAAERNSGGSSCAPRDGFHNAGLWFNQSDFAIVLVPEGTAFGDIGDDAQIQSNGVAVVFPTGLTDRLAIDDGTLQPLEP